MSEQMFKIFMKDSTNMLDIKDSSIDLIITSPPYPMIEMWIECLIRRVLQHMKKCTTTYLRRGKSVIGFLNKEA